MDFAFVLAKDLDQKERAAFQSLYTARKKSVSIGVLLACAGIFCGIPGLHKFYTGNVGAGVAYLVGALISAFLAVIFVGLAGLAIIWILCIIDACTMAGTIQACNQKIARDIISEIEFMKG